MSVCLDAWAVLAWLDGEERALRRVNDLIESRPVISWVNLVEVYDRLERDHSRDAADETLGALRASLAPDLLGTARMIEAARLKARAAIALGDCFAAATPPCRRRAQGDTWRQKDPRTSGTTRALARRRRDRRELHGRSPPSWPPGPRIKRPSVEQSLETSSIRPQNTGWIWVSPTESQ